VEVILHNFFICGITVGIRQFLIAEHLAMINHGLTISTKTFSAHYTQHIWLLCLKLTYIMVETFLMHSDFRSLDVAANWFC